MARSVRTTKRVSSTDDIPTKKGSPLAPETGIGPLVHVVETGSDSLTPTDPARAVMDALAGRFTPEVLCNKLQDLLDFQKTSVNRQGEVVTTAEGSVQLRAVETIIAYLMGRPVDRQQVISMSVQATMDDLLDKARKSPVFRATLRQLLDDLDRAA